MPSPVRLMVFRNCFGMIMSVSTLITLRGAATPSKTVNLSMVLSIPYSRRACLQRNRCPRASADFEHLDSLYRSLRHPFRKMDCWVKPGNDSELDRPDRNLLQPLSRKAAPRKPSASGDALLD